MRACGVALITALGLLGATAPALAKQPHGQSDFRLDDTFALGIVERRLDTASELIGWHLNGDWYLGREHGDIDEAMALIWQGDQDQFSISTEGIRFTRRF